MLYCISLNKYKTAMHGKKDNISPPANRGWCEPGGRKFIRAPQKLRTEIKVSTAGETTAVTRKRAAGCS
ncbi:hypothetical protein JOC37_000139 [Desulfohalotomaculum tongense]|nr:hypothetical protein [Desulforadius tongensis]